MYLDPGFGGMLVQVLIAVVAAGGIVLFTLRRKIKAFFSKNKELNTTATDTGASNPVNNGDNEIIDMLSDENTSDN